MGYTSVNFYIVDEKEAKISVFDRGLWYGEGVFETILGQNGKIFRLKEHVERLFESARIAGIEHRLEAERIEREVEKVFESNALKNAKINILLSSGIGKYGGECENPTILITAKEFSGFPAEIYEKGVKIVLSENRRSLPSAKTLNYLPNVLAYKRALANKKFEAVFVSNGLVLEGTTSNIFIVKNGKVFTPESSVLKGITRNEVLKIASKFCEVQERDVVVGELFSADEVFITSTLKKVVPVVEIDGRAVGSSAPGPITRKIMEEFEKVLNSE